MLHQELKTAFLQGDESQASELFNDMLRTSVRLGLFAAMEEEITSLCGAKYFPAPESAYQRAGSERGGFIQTTPSQDEVYLSGHTRSGELGGFLAQLSEKRSEG